MARIEDNGYSKDNRRAGWMGDYADRNHVLPGGGKLDSAQFIAEDGAIVKLTANAAQGAVAIAFAALTNPIPAGTLLPFGVGKYARTTAPAAKGAVGVAVEALPVALNNGDQATYPGSGMKKKLVISGTFVGRTRLERDANPPVGFGPAAANDDELFLLVHDVTDADRDNDCTLYRHGSIVKENFLPGWDTMAADLKAAIRARYQCTIGAE